MWNVKSKRGRVVVSRFERPASTKRRVYLSASPAVLLLGGVARAQYGQYPQPGQHPLLDEAADRVIQKYQQSSCEQLWQQKEQPRSQRQEEVVQFLRNNPQMRAAFINRIAAPVANKMFACGMIP